MWFMRQAGRSLPEYREIRRRHAFFEINQSAELTAEVTLQPVRRHAVDAAVMFADIMTPVVAMGVGVELVEGVGPVIADPIRTAAAVERLRVPDPAETVAPILEAIRIVRAELAAEQAVVGFCGGPFTVAGYLIDPASRYVVAQARAGADVVQLFDSWIGALSPADYEEFVAPWSTRILAALADAGVPSIHFGTGAATLLGSLARAGGDVIGLDWRIPLDEGWALVGEDRGVQGNLDPAVLLGPWERVESAARDVLRRAGGRPGHIFNLGHGVLPETDPDVLGRLRALVHAETAREESHTFGASA